MVVDTYGVPMYKEANPAVFACVSFPFLFGVMFGDMGHGFFLFSVGSLLVLGKDKLEKSPLGALLFARYFLVLMGFFAMYNGLIYNEFFAIPIDLFGSCYSQDVYSYNSSDPYSAVGYHRLNSECVYPVGFDPRWQQSTNFLTLSNSIKMKIAVILGVS